IFTPSDELPFAGHPTLGTAFVLVSEGRVSSPAVQEVTAGEVPVEVDLDAGVAWMRQLPARFGPTADDREKVARAVGLTTAELDPDLTPQLVFTGLTQLIVAARDEATVAKAAVDPQAIAAVVDETGAGGLYLFAAIGSGAKA